MLPVAGLALLAAMLPFLVSGHVGIIGTGVNDDMSAHLSTAWWIQRQRGLIPVGALGGQLPLVGYPIGPHGLADALSLNRLALVKTFSSVIIVVAPLMALVAMAALTHVRRPLRWIGALLVAFSYLTVSYMVQSAFKETTEGLLVITAALAAREILRDFRPEQRWRAGIPLGVVIAASVYVYSYSGVFWTGGVVAAVALASMPWRRAVDLAGGAFAGAALLIAPALPEIGKFVQSPFNSEEGMGNLPWPVNPFEMLGVWLRSDFRFPPDPAAPTIFFAALAGIAAIVALVRFIRRHDLALLAALIPPLGIAAFAHQTQSPYLEGKAFAVAAPIVALVIVGGVLLPTSAPRRSPRRVALGAIAGLAAVAAALSSFMALRDGPVGPPDHALELAQLRPHIRGLALFMPKDDMAQWELIGLPVAQGRGLYAPWWFKPRMAKPDETLANFFDFDSFLPMDLNQVRYVITTRTPFQSWPPPNWRPLKRTQSYILWKRHGRMPQRLATDLGDQPAMYLDCRTSLAQLRLRQAKGGTALVLPDPIVARQEQWQGQPVDAGQSGTMTLQVPRGRWDLSMQYASVTGLDVRAGRIAKRLPATIDRVGPYYLVGSILQQKDGPLTIKATARKMNLIARLLGAPGATHPLDSPNGLPLAAVALTRHNQEPVRIPAEQACGRYVDFFQPPRSAVGSPEEQDLP
jgi:hypothetical protein